MSKGRYRPMNECVLTTLACVRTVATFAFVRTLHQLEMEEGYTFPIMVERLMKSGDNFLNGSRDKGPMQLMEQITDLLKTADST